MTKKISTSALAKTFKLSSQQLFKLLSDAGFICRQEDNWLLLTLGEAVGGEYRNSPKYGEYIVWPDSLTVEKIREVEPEEKPANLLTARQLSNEFSLPANRINHLLAELGWLERGLKGWKATAHGLRLGAHQKEDFKSGIPYVAWPKALLSNPVLLDTLQQLRPSSKPASTYRAIDGHQLDSAAQLVLDNWLYMAEILHATRRRLPIEEDYCCSFYLPAGKLYIEICEQPTQQQQIQQRYAKYGFNLITLSEQEVANLDEVLPKQLLRYGILSD